MWHPRRGWFCWPLSWTTPPPTPPSCSLPLQPSIGETSYSMQFYIKYFFGIYTGTTVLRRTVETGVRGKLGLLSHRLDLLAVRLTALAATSTNTSRVLASLAATVGTHTQLVSREWATVLYQISRIISRTPRTTRHYFTTPFRYSINIFDRSIY